MSYTFKDAAGSTVYASSDGAGSSGDPYVPQIGGYAELVEDSNTWAASATAYNSYNTWPQWAKSCVVVVENATNQSVRIDININQPNPVGGAQTGVAILYGVAADVAAAASKSYGAHAIDASGSRYDQVEALGQSWYGMRLQISVTPSASATGTVQLSIIWSS